MFNLAETTTTFAVPFSSLGIRSGQFAGVADVVWGEQWSGTLAPHASATIHVPTAAAALVDAEVESA